MIIHHLISGGRPNIENKLDLLCERVSPPGEPSCSRLLAVKASKPQHLKEKSKQKTWAYMINSFKRAKS